MCMKLSSWKKLKICFSAAKQAFFIAYVLLNVQEKNQSCGVTEENSVNAINIHGPCTHEMLNKVFNEFNPERKTTH